MNRLKKERITISIIVINVLVYLYQLYLGNMNPELQYFFMVDNSIHPGGNIKTIITNMFIHKDILHLGMNMLALYFIGTFLERSISEKKYIMLYFVSGLSASLISFLYIVFVSPQIVIGASGAIFGLWAYYSLYKNEFNEFLLIAGLSNIAMIFGGLPIAWYAHLGGAIAGIFLWKIEQSNINNKRKNIYKRGN